MVYTHSVKEDSLKKKQSNMKLNIDENFSSFCLRNGYLTSYAFQVLSFTAETTMHYRNYYKNYFYLLSIILKIISYVCIHS